MKAFKAARKKATLTEIGQGLMDAKRYWDRMETPMDKIPYPATWLNQDRWLDEHPVVEAAAPAAGAEDPSGWMHRTPENTP